MPLPFLKIFTACITAGKRAFLEQLRIRQQNGIEKRESNYLPEELIIESILTRLPVRTLAVCCCVSKLWYNSILNDSRFHLIHNIQNKNNASLVFNVHNVVRGSTEDNYFFNLLGGEKVDMKILLRMGVYNTYEPVGFCNGLTCIRALTPSNYTRGTIDIVNPNTGDMLVICYLYPTGGYIYLCHGFGFDSSSQAYKVVIIFVSKANDEFLCMVITLGTISWRKILTSTSDISLPPGFAPFPIGMVTRVSRTFCRQGTLCGDDLYWRTKNNAGNSNEKIELLLSFDLHSEKIKFIRFPTECTLTTPTNELLDLVVDYLTEFKGYPCIARSERIANNDHCSGHGRCTYKTGDCCCYYKLHMYILKDKDKQLWCREKTFDVHHHLCWYFYNSAATPPTRILTFSDQVLLYWFNGDHLIFYNLQDKHFNVVKCYLSYPWIFQAEMNEDLERRIGVDDNINCPYMDYQLHSQVENIVSLKTFIPKGAKTSESHCADDLTHLLGNHLMAGWLTTGRKKHTYYVFSYS